MSDRILSLLSLATKAGKTTGGSMLVEKAVKEGKASLVILSSEVSQNTRKKFTNMCTYYNVPLYTYGTKEELGKFTGKEFRAVIALQGRDFYDSFVKAFTNMEVTE
jgi:ribosomal protein L7Ae-like RNA K-turn-binding protein